VANPGLLALLGGAASPPPRSGLLDELLAGSGGGEGLTEANSLLALLRGGGAGRQGSPAAGRPQVMDTSGSRLGFKGAFGDILGNETLGDLVGGAIPGGMASGLLGRGLRALAGGPYGVVGAEEIGIGHPLWGQKMAALRQARQMNRIDRGLSDRGRDATRDPQGHGGGGRLGSDRDSRAGGPR